MYAIVENNVARYASNAAIRDHLKGQGVQMARQDFDRLSELERNAFGVFTIAIQRDSLLPYQDHTVMPLSFDGVTVTKHLAAVDMALSEAQAKAKAALAAKRYDVETGGITVSALEIATDRHTQNVFTSARILAKEDANYSVNWKAPQGWLVVNAAEIIAMADAVAAHVQACFDNEKTLSDQIDAAADLTALRVIDINGGW